jgi:hypothetical protein
VVSEDSISRVQGDRLADERLDKDLHPITRANDEMGQLLLDVVIRKSATTRCKDKTLLVRLNTQSSLHVIRGVGRFDLQGDRLADERLDKDLHPIMRVDDGMGQLLLDVVERVRPLAAGRVEYPIFTSRYSWCRRIRSPG